MKHRMSLVGAALGAASLLVACTAQGFGVNLPHYQGVFEFSNEITGHYVLLSDGNEMAGVLAGSAGPGWRRTGFDFTVQADPQLPGAVDVCRFYAPSSNSHFFTGNAAECESLKGPDTGWIFEGIAFRAVLPVDGQCPASLVPVYRAYNNRWMYRDSNHRFTGDARIRDRMSARGWIDEGIAFCVARAEHSLEREVVADGMAAMKPACDGNGMAESSCVAVRNLVPLTNHVDKNMGLMPYALNPAYSPSYDAATGWSEWWGRLFTAQGVNDSTSVAAHTFVQRRADDFYPETATGSPMGIYLDGADRIAGEYASVGHVHAFVTQTLMMGTGEAPIRPWLRGRERDLMASFSATPQYVHRKDATAHGYGGYLLALRDVASGKGLYVTLQAYGSVPPGDFVARDVNSGRVIVSTVFREQSAFGQNLGGHFLPCNDSCNAPTPGYFYRFVIGFDAIGKVIALARGTDPGFSEDPGDYLLEGFECRHETYGSASIGGGLGACMLSISH